MTIPNTRSLDPGLKDKKKRIAVPGLHKLQKTYAASDVFVTCVRYWLVFQGANVQRGTQHHPQYNAIAWAEWSQAHSVLPLLDEALGQSPDNGDLEMENTSDQGGWDTLQLVTCLECGAEKAHV